MSDIFGGADNDILGGTSNDELMKGYGGDDELSGGSGNDTLVGGGGDDLLNGDAGEDTLKGGGGADQLNGGADNDTLVGGKGADTLDGGEGDDTYQITGKDFGTIDTFSDSGTGGEDEIDASKVVQLMLAGDFSAASGIESIVGDVEDKLEIIGDGSAVNWDFTGIDLVNVSQITGSGENDVITGSDGDDKVKGGGGDDELNGGGGDDNLTGGGGADTLDGGDGDDKLKGGGGNDVMDGGEGSDTYVYKAGESAAGDEITDSGTSGTDVLDVSALESIQLGDNWNNKDDEIVIIEEFRGNEETGTKIVAGEHAVDWSFEGATMVDISQIVGSAEGDNIGGSESDDRIKGGGGDDSLSGGNGNDNLKGGGGDDTLDGGAGVDTLKGGGGNDTLVYDADDELVDGQGGEDTLSLIGTAGGGLSILDTAGATIRNIEAIDLGGGGNVLQLDIVSVELLSETSDTLTVTGGESDFIFSLDEWDQGADAGGYHVYTSGAATLLVQDGVNVGGINTPADEPPVVFRNTGVQLDEGATLESFLDVLVIGDVDTVLGTVIVTIDIAPVNGQLELTGNPGVGITSFNLDQFYLGQVVYVQNVPDAVADSFGFTVTDGTSFTSLNLFQIIINADITGTTFDDTLAGGAGDDTLIGGDGNDTLDGGGGDDSLYGDAADDTLHGDAGFDSLSGGAGSDTLDGGAEDDTLTGDNGNDALRGGTGDDSLTGGLGNDSLQGGDGDDNLDGGAGVHDEADYSDQLVDVTVNLVVITAQDTGAGLDTLTGIEDLFGGSGNDVLTGNGDANFILGGAGDDVIYGGGGSDDLNGNEGIDRLYGGDASDFLRGGAGNDLLVGGNGDDVYIVYDADTIVEKADEGTDSVIFGFDGAPGAVFQLGDNVENAALAGSENFEVTGNELDNILDGDTFHADGHNVLDGAGGNDLLQGGSGSDTLLGADGDDQLSGFVGDDQLYGGLGIDELDGGDGDDSLYGDQGMDTLQGGEGVDRIFGGVGNDLLRGGSANDVLVGGDGIDDMYGDNEDDQLFGGNGTDHLYGDSGADELWGDDGDDILFGGTGNDAFDESFGDGADVLYGGAGSDHLYGGVGDDVLNGGAGDDMLFGGAGSDTLDYSAAAGGVTVNLNTDTVNAEGTDSIFSIENVIGGAGNDIIEGDGNANNLFGGAGNDNLSGGGGNDFLSGGSGNDTLTGGDGDDQYNIGDADDTVTENADEGTDLLKLDVAGLGYGGPYTIDANVENATLVGNGDFDVSGNGLDNVIDASGQSSGDNVLDGGGGNDMLLGGAGSDGLNGGAGNDLVSGDDTLDGGAGQDSLDGMGGDDILLGGSELDNLNGGADDDLLNGGTGDDVLFGDTGDDTFVFDSALGPGNVDLIQDFQGAGSVGGDVMQLDASIFTVLSAGNLAGSDFYSGPDPGAATAGAYIIYDTDSGALYYDADGDASNGGQVQFATLSGNPGIDESDFIVVGGV